jgi:hypothetical protein
MEKIPISKKASILFQYLLIVNIIPNITCMEKIPISKKAVKNGI